MSEVTAERTTYNQYPQKTGSRPGERIPMPVRSPIPKFPEEKLSIEELSKPYILDGSVKTIHRNPHYSESTELDSRNTDYVQISEDGSRFCTLNSDSQNSFYFGPKIFNELENFPTASTIPSVQRSLTEIYRRFNEPTAIETFGTFGVIFNTPDKKNVAVIANCGGSVYLYRPNIRETKFSSDISVKGNHDKRELYELADPNHPGSIGYDSNPNYLHLITIMLQPGDVILATPNQLDKSGRADLIANLSKFPKQPSSELVKVSAEIIRRSVIRATNETKDATALAIFTKTTSNYIDDRVIKTDQFPTILPQFKNAKNLNELSDAIRAMKTIRGLNKTYSAREIIKLIQHGKLEAIPRAAGLREAVSRLYQSPKNPLQGQDIVFPPEIA